jgi:hypothetical protein
MSDIAALEALLSQRFFEAWDDYVDPANIKRSEIRVRRLVEDLIGLGAVAAVEDAHKAMVRCVKRFNRPPYTWICTIERESIGDAIVDVVEAAGFEWDEEWLEDAEW